MTRFRGFPVAARLVVPTRKRKQQKQEYQDAMTANDTREFIVTTDEAVPTPPAGQVTLYWTEDGPRQKDETGTASDVGGGGADSGISYVDVQLTDAQIKALPSTPVTLVAAPGAGALLVFHAAALVCVKAGDYTNIQDFASLQVGYSDGLGGNTGVSQFLANDDGAGLFTLTVLLTGGDTTYTILGPGEANNTTGWGIVRPAITYALGAGFPLVLMGDNAGGGNFTGGHASNTLSVRVWYSTLPAAAFS